MLDWIRNFVAPPVFEDDEKTLSARLTNYVLLILLVVTVVSTLIIIPIEPQEIIFNLLFGVVLVAVILGLRYMLYRGLVRWPAWLISGVLWGGITFLLVFSGGVRNTVVTGYFLSVAVGAFLLGGSGAITFSILSALAVVTFYWLEVEGILPSDVTLTLSLTQPITLIITLGLTAVLLYLTFRHRSRMLEVVRHGTYVLEEENQALQERHAELMVQMRALEERSSYLEASAEVGRAVTSILEMDRLIRQVVGLIQERFALYYVGLFLIDEAGEWAVLRAGTGEAGRAMLARGHRLRIGGGSMIGWCIANAQARVALDVGEDAVRLATPELPETRSEAALPLRSRGQVRGALTIQSDRPAAFDETTIAVLQLMADQVAIAIDNVLLLTESREAVEAMRQAYGEISRNAWVNLLRLKRQRGVRSEEQGLFTSREVWGPEALESARTAEVVWPETPNAEGQFSLAVPIEIYDMVVGVIDTHKPVERGPWTEEEVELLKALADQLGLALENARFYEDTQRRAAREQLTREITDNIRSAMNVEDAIQRAIREMGQVLGVTEVVARIGVMPEKPREGGAQ